jgi:hypothetical protein
MNAMTSVHSSCCHRGESRSGACLTHAISPRFDQYRPWTTCSPGSRVMGARLLARSAQHSDARTAVFRVTAQ